MKAMNFAKEFEKLRHIAYGDLSFRAICPICGEPVKADESIPIGGDGNFIKQPNATCFSCGRFEMPFDGKIIR